MANADGGDLIYGIDANEGVPVTVSGIPLTEIDAIKLRFESMLNNCVEPRIPGVAMQSVDLGDGNCVLVVRSRRSWRLPHRVTVGAHVHFYGRGAASTFPMDVTQLREAFLLSEQQGDRARNFVVERLLKIEQGRGPVSLMDGAKMVLHVLPISSLSRHSSQQLIVPKMERTDFQLYESGSRAQKPNLDGFVIADSREGKCEFYTQVFRTGAVEALMTFVPRTPEDKGLNSGWVEAPTLRTLESIVEQLRKREIAPPYVVGLSFVHVQGCYLNSNSHFSNRKPARYPDSILILPDVMIESLDSFRSWEVMRPVFNTFWNAFEHDGSPNYDENGNWRDR
jgi:hypothetical protein